MSLRIFFALCIFLCVPFFSEAAGAHRFQPLKDTLAQYRILKVPESIDYPDIPAVGILSYQQYRQGGLRHTRTYHKIIKILTAAGKEYTNVRISCFSTCRVEARTIKSNGKIINLPGKDLHRTENLSGYSSVFFVAQFALPGVEPGDIIEYYATVDYPMPFLLEDFRFSEPYPVMKGVFQLSHPVDDSYSFVRYSSPGGPPVKVSQDRHTDEQVTLNSTIFIVDNVPAAVVEPYSPKARQGHPGMRLIIEARSGMRFDVFKDWSSYGQFLIGQTTQFSTLSADLVSFARNASGDTQDIREIITRIYSSADKRIQITDESLLSTGFEFTSPDKSFADKIASPHDFALFLAACFKVRRWTTELVLVNSHEQSETSKAAVFPPDLDLVFLSVKTPIGEFLLDCSENGIPAFHLSSASANRFALAVPFFAVATRFSTVPVYLTTLAYKEGNRNHMEITAVPGSNQWDLDFRWMLGGEYQASFVRLFRQKGHTELQKALIQTLRTRLEVFDLKDITYRFLKDGMEISGKASRPRIKIQENVELLQNELWNSGFEIRPYLMENRTNRLLLPSVGEISTTVIVRSKDFSVTLPQSVTLECAPVKYSLSFTKNSQEVRIDETLTIRDMAIDSGSFSEFSGFLDNYYAKHFWALLLTPVSAPQTSSL